MMGGGGEWGRMLSAYIAVMCLISAVIGWAVIEGIIWLVSFIARHIHWVAVAVAIGMCLQGCTMIDYINNGQLGPGR